jgi:hypothetical protein
LTSSFKTKANKQNGKKNIHFHKNPFTFYTVVFS